MGFLRIVAVISSLGGLKIKILYTFLMSLIYVPYLVHRHVVSLFALIFDYDGKRIKHKAPAMLLLLSEIVADTHDYIPLKLLQTFMRS
jgi:hypothetical protein